MSQETDEVLAKIRSEVLSIQLRLDKVCKHSLRYAGVIPETATTMSVYVPNEVGLDRLQDSVIHLTLTKVGV